VVPPTWSKGEYHRSLSNVWRQAATELGTANNVFVIGYSLPETDSFFRYLYALGSQSRTRIKRLVIFNPDPDGQVKRRFEGLLGGDALDKLEFVSGDKGKWENSIETIIDILKADG
jgi:hypothetical protein